MAGERDKQTTDLLIEFREEKERRIQEKEEARRKEEDAVIRKAEEKAQQILDKVSQPFYKRIFKK
ncbi:hypothetical protein [Paenibacillus sp. BC26]|uniref:hypothetical protein n=1 Tax=Paenibacillus sp. BC26 TaxID=1881032 RepID=UPI00116014A4|nr:hypothetical protein [Paenibacillus sp. BC26]